MKLEFVLAVLVFFPFIAGLLSYGAGVVCQRRNVEGQNKQETFRDVVVILSVVAEFVIMSALSVSICGRTGMEHEFKLVIPGSCGGTLGFALDGFRVICGCLASFMWMIAAILSKEYLTHHKNRNRYYLFLLMTLGATM